MNEKRLKLKIFFIGIISKSKTKINPKQEKNYKNTSDLANFTRFDCCLEDENPLCYFSPAYSFKFALDQA